jgi:hypothetical protein
MDVVDEMLDDAQRKVLAVQTYILLKAVEQQCRVNQEPCHCTAVSNEDHPVWWSCSTSTAHDKVNSGFSRMFDVFGEPTDSAPCVGEVFAR